MPTLSEIKPQIRDVIVANIDEKVTPVYWQSERGDEPQKPYCLLTEMSERILHRTTEWTIADGKKGVRVYKQINITVGVYVDGLDDYDTNKAFAYEQTNRIRNLFERENVWSAFNFTILDMTGIRPLNEVVVGGYLYRYEFDMTINFDEFEEYSVGIGKAVGLELVNANDENVKIKFDIDENSD